jgi:hypothetical protein
MLYQVDLAWAGFELTTLVVIGTDCIGSLRANHYAITLPLREGLYKKYINTCTQYTIIGQKSQLLIVGFTTTCEIRAYRSRLRRCTTSVRYHQPNTVRCDRTISTR